MAGEMATEAGGTYPTEMHSFFFKVEDKCCPNVLCDNSKIMTLEKESENCVHFSDREKEFLSLSTKGKEDKNVNFKYRNFVYKCLLILSRKSLVFQLPL